MNTKVVEFVRRQGKLAVVLTEAGRAEDDEIRAYRDAHGINAALHEVCERQLCNGWDVLTDDDLVAVGALTGCEFIVSDSLEHDDAGKFVRVGSVYWNPNYALQDEIELLLTKGEFVLTQSEAE